MKTYFFGWENCKWFIREFGKVYSSSESSYFSKKRIESGLAFLVLQWGMIGYLLNNYTKMPMTDMFIWASIEGIICGYTLSKIENAKSKKSESDNTPTA